MKLFKLLVFFSICNNTVFSQEFIKGKILDSATNAPIPYVNIGIKQLAIGTVSNYDGLYELKISSPKDVITFSSIGYETLSVLASELKENGNIKLTGKNYLIQAIEVSAQRFDGEDRIFGVKNEKRGHSIGFGSRQLGSEIGALIEISKPTYIKSANFVLNHADGDSILFRVNIYDYKNQSIGENILKENIFIVSKQKRGTITIDLTNLNIILDNDVLLSLEWIKDDDGKGNVGITFDTKKARSLEGIYVKETSIGDFKKLDYKKNSLKPCFYFLGKQTK